MAHNQLLTSRELTIKMAAQLKDTLRVRIVSAYMTFPAIRWLTEHVRHSNIKILGRFKPNDFLNGASDFTALETALQNGYEVYMLENLHSKIYELDEKTIFTGSANFTSRGFSLCSTPNEEVAIEVPYHAGNKAFIDKLFRNSVQLDPLLIELMKEKLEIFYSVPSIKNDDNWGNEFKSKHGELFLSNLPLCPPFDYCKQYKNEPELDFAIVTKSLNDLSLASCLFKKTRCYTWLYNKVSARINDGVRFGELSQLLHEAIRDDPSPYRMQVKEILANLLQFIQLLASDTFELSQPGARSQILKLKER